MRVQGLQGHVAGDQPGRGGSAHDGARRRGALQAGCQVGCLAQGQGVLARAQHDRADDHRARVNADTRAPRLQAARGMQRLDSLDQRQASAHGP